MLQRLKDHLDKYPDAGLKFFYGGVYSQWYYCPFYVGRLYFRTAEHYMMYEKAILFDDQEIAEKMIQTEEPRQVKRMGKLVKNFNQAIWDKEKFDIVLRGNWYKFSSDTFLREELLSTKNTVLVEASPTDIVWGIGRGTTYPFLRDFDTWRGENLLGFAIMLVREELARQ